MNMSNEDKLRRALAALKPFVDAYPTDGRYLNPVRLIYSDGAKGSLAVEDFGDARDTYEALAATQEQHQVSDDWRAGVKATMGYLDIGGRTSSEFGNRDALRVRVGVETKWDWRRVTDAEYDTILTSLRSTPPVPASMEASRMSEPQPSGKGGPTVSDPDRPYCKPDQSCCDFCCGN